MQVDATILERNRIIKVGTRDLYHDFFRHSSIAKAVAIFHCRRFGPSRCENERGDVLYSPKNEGVARLRHTQEAGMRFCFEVSKLLV